MEHFKIIFHVPGSEGNRSIRCISLALATRHHHREIHIKRTFLLPFYQYFLHRVLSHLPYVESGIHSDHPGRESEQEPLLQN